MTMLVASASYSGKCFRQRLCRLVTRLGHQVKSSPLRVVHSHGTGELFTRHLTSYPAYAKTSATGSRRPGRRLVAMVSPTDEVIFITDRSRLYAFKAF